MPRPLRVLDLFSGIGGFALGLERAGMETTAFCEIKPHSRAVLAKHWPGVPCYHDITTLTGEQLVRDDLTFDVICGGFPCQDISAAGKGAGIEGARSGLWSHYARLIGEVGPRWVIIENSPMLRTRGADRVLRDLEANGYTCWPFVVGAVHAGAPHKRQRVFILAYADSDDGGSGRAGRPNPSREGEYQPQRSLQGVSSDTDGHGRGEWPVQHKYRGPSAPDTSPFGEGRSKVVCPDADRPGLEVPFTRETGQRPSVVGTCQWSVEPAVGRMAHGVPSRVDRIAALGNAVVPQVAEAIGNAILAAERVMHVNRHRGL